MRLVLVTTGLLGFFTQIVTAAEPDRLTQVKKLTVEYAAANKIFDDTDWPVETAPDQIRRYEAWPAWSYIPRFVRLAEAQLDVDEAAFLCCQWILDRTDNAGNEDRRIFAADQKAWEILAAHPRTCRDLATFCLKAVVRATVRACRNNSCGVCSIAKIPVARKSGSCDAGTRRVLRTKIRAASNCGSTVRHRPASPSIGKAKGAPDCCREPRRAANGSKFKAESIGLFLRGSGELCRRRT